MSRFPATAFPWARIRVVYSRGLQVARVHIYGHLDRHCVTAPRRRHRRFWGAHGGKECDSKVVRLDDIIGWNAEHCQPCEDPHAALDLTGLEEGVLLPDGIRRLTKHLMQCPTCKIYVASSWRRWPVQAALRSRLPTGAETNGSDTAPGDPCLNPRAVRSEA